RRLRIFRLWSTTNEWPCASCRRSPSRCKPAPTAPRCTSTASCGAAPRRAGLPLYGHLRGRTSPSRVHAIRGEHIVTADLLGRRPRAVTVELNEDQRLTLALDAAPPAH